MKISFAILFSGSWFLLSLLSCRPDPQIIEVPVPYAIDSLVLLPQWENHPSFFGEDKKQWIGWADDSLCLLLGNHGLRHLNSADSILSNWGNQGSSAKHTNENYRPTLSRYWVVAQDHTDGWIEIGYSLIQSTRTFFSLDEHLQTQGLSFYSRRHWNPMGDVGTLVKASPNEFGWLGWAKDTANLPGLVYVAGHLSSIPGNPIVDRVEWHPFPVSPQSFSVPAFLTKVGEAALVGITNSFDSTSFFGEILFTWHPDQGFERIPAERYGPAGMRTAFSAHDGETAYLMVGNGDLFEVEPDGTLELRYKNIYATGVSHASAARDLRGYFAFFFNQELTLLDKTTSNLWRAPNLGLDGHNINDLTLFKDTLLLSSRTGGVFYQAFSDVWPEEQR